jgi:hypothetical protein
MKKLFVLFAAAALLVSCKKETINIINTANPPVFDTTRVIVPVIPPVTPVTVVPVRLDSAVFAISDTSYGISEIAIISGNVTAYAIPVAYLNNPAFGSYTNAVLFTFTYIVKTRPGITFDLEQTPQIDYVDYSFAKIAQGMEVLATTTIGADGYTKIKNQVLVMRDSRLSKSAMFATVLNFYYFKSNHQPDVKPIGLISGSVTI